MTPTNIAPEIASHTRHKIAVRLLPFLFLLYIVNYLDRTSVAYAALGMSRELGFSDRVFGLGAGIFFVSYVALQIPGALLVERWSARRMISITMIAWGSLTALTAFVHTPGQLYLARFVLGAAEAGFFPGVIVYLSHWFSCKDRAKASSNFMAAIPLSFVVGSPIAGWILGHKWLDMQGWRWLFLLEGMPAIVLGAIAFFFLTDWPREALWLTPEERLATEKKLMEEREACASTTRVWQVLRSRTVLLLAGAAFFSYFSLYCFAFWFPTMLKRLTGFSDMRVGLLGAVPYLATFVAMQIHAWHSDKTEERHWHAAIPMFVGAAALLGLLSPPHSIGPLLVLFTLVYLGMMYLPTFWAIPTEALRESTAATAVGVINAVGNVAGFAGPYLFGYLNTRTGSFSAGFVAMTISFVVAGLMILGTPRRARASTA